MRLVRNTAMVAGLVACLAARADTLHGLDRTAAQQRSDATALTQDGVRVPLRPSAPALVRDGSSRFDFPQTQFQPLQYNRAVPSTTVLTLDDGSPLLAINIPSSSLEQYAGSSICALTLSCSADFGASKDTIEVEPGGLEAIVSAIAPEPPSMLLIATGLLSLAGVVRRRTHGRRRDSSSRDRKDTKGQAGSDPID